MSAIRSNVGLYVVVMLSLWVIGSSGVQAQQVSYSGSMQYTSGTYFFDKTTETFSFSNGLGINGERMSISFSVPYIVQNSPWISYGAAGFLPTGGPQHKFLQDSTGRRPGKGDGDGGGNTSDFTARKIASDDPPIIIPDTASYTESSFGDPTLFANVKLFTSPHGDTNIQLNTSLKVPVADPNTGFGTGEWDIGLGASASHRLEDFFFFADLTKWWFGDLPDLELKDPISYTFGVSHWIGGGKWFINSTLTGYTEIINDYDPPLDFGAGLGFIASERATLNSTISMGMSESSADVSVGVGWSIKL